MVEVSFKRIDLKDVGIDVYEYFTTILDDFPVVIYIEIGGPEPSVEPNLVVKAYTATSTVLKMTFEILESFKEIQYSGNDPEKWIEEELKRIFKAIKKYEFKLHDKRLMRALIEYVTDGDSAAYIIAFRD